MKNTIRRVMALFMFISMINFIPSPTVASANGIEFCQTAPDQNEVTNIKFKTQLEVFKDMNEYIEKKAEEKREAERLARIAAEEAERRAREEAARQEQMKNLEYQKQIIIDSSTLKINKDVTAINGNTAHTVNVVASFYSDLECENGGWTGITTSQTSLRKGVLASVRKIPLGSVVVSDKIKQLLNVDTKVFIIEDRMNEKVAYNRVSDNEIPMDVFVPRLANENDSAYRNRVMNLGVQRFEVQIFYN